LPTIKSAPNAAARRRLSKTAALPSPITHPNQVWVTQQARQVVWKLYQHYQTNFCSINPISVQIPATIPKLSIRLVSYLISLLTHLTYPKFPQITSWLDFLCPFHTIGKTFWHGSFYPFRGGETG